MGEGRDRSLADSLGSSLGKKLRSKKKETHLENEFVGGGSGGADFVGCVGWADQVSRSTVVRGSHDAGRVDDGNEGFQLLLARLERAR